MCRECTKATPVLDTGAASGLALVKGLDDLRVPGIIASMARLVYFARQTSPPTDSSFLKHMTTRDSHARVQAMNDRL